MEIREFHAGLRQLLNIERDQLSVLGAIDNPDNPSLTWESFRADPFKFFIRAPDSVAESILALVRAGTVAGTDREQDISDAADNITAENVGYYISVLLVSADLMDVALSTLAERVKILERRAMQ
jgi:hypothetical protein